jgi:hypothetical protein
MPKIIAKNAIGIKNSAFMGLGFELKVHFVPFDASRETRLHNAGFLFSG